MNMIIFFPDFCLYNFFLTSSVSSDFASQLAKYLLFAYFETLLFFFLFFFIQIKPLFMYYLIFILKYIHDEYLFTFFWIYNYYLYYLLCLCFNEYEYLLYLIFRAVQKIKTKYIFFYLLRNEPFKETYYY